MKRPSFQFYPADWLSDFKARALTSEERGVYIDLLCFMWLEEDCSLPSDTAILERMLNAGSTTVQRVLELFVNEGSKITHKRLLEEREKQDKFKEFASKAGKASAKKRNEKSKSPVERPFNDRSTTVQRKSNSSSSSSTSVNDLSKDKSLVSTEKKEKTFDLEDGQYLLASLLFSLILENNPNHKSPDLQAWAGEIDKMIRLDKRTPETIEFLIRWSQQDPFWKANILSTAKLRQQYDQLFLKAKGQWEEAQKNKIPEY